MTEENHAISNGRGWLQSIREAVAKLAAAEESGDSDAAREEIYESVLSVRVRDGWRSPGDRTAAECDAEPEEYEILLSTGGPALRIYGELDHGETPDDWPELQWQDWGTPWTPMPLEEGDREAVTRFARVFYFGEG
jgi:hypothetical protein